MNADDPLANAAVGRAFVEAFDARDLATLERLMAEDFVWHTAMVADGETEPRPFQSAALKGMELTLLGAMVKTKAEMLANFAHLFEVAETIPVRRFRMTVVSVTAQDDRVAVEIAGDTLNPTNGRRYRNLYFVLMRIRDGQLVLYKEYQDTLHIYDVWHAE